MSSSSAYEPDQDSDSDVDLPSKNERGRSSSSRIAPAETRSRVSDNPVPTEPRDNVINLVGSGSEEDEAEETDGEDVVEFSPQNRFERADAIYNTLRPTCVDAYTKLLTEMENDICANKMNESDEPYTVTQNGAVIWTSTEKEMLFHVLDQKGKNGIPQIAAAIGTKSELEVMDYLKLLHRGLEGQHILERQLKTIIMGDIPAAAEISSQCCVELEKYSDALVMQEDNAIMRASRLKFGGSNGVLTEWQAKALIKKSEAEQGNFHLPAGLLRLPSWIQLSSQLFMNFGGARERDSWSYHTQSEDESPIIYGEAFMDFYGLAMSLTRRLVQSSIYFAMARIRDMQRTGVEKANVIRKRDVRAAMDVLLMKPLPRNHFLDKVRQHRLVITDDKDNPGRNLSYDEAEEILNAEDDLSDSDSEDSDIDKGVSSGDENAYSNNEEPLDNHPRRHPLSMDAEEDHADIQDREQSRQEELRLWELLEKPGPAELAIPIVTEEENAKEAAARKMPADRKTREDLIDWREHTLYRSEWEEYGASLQDVEDELEENRRKRRRLEYEYDGHIKEAEEQPPFLSASVVNSEEDEEGVAQTMEAEQRPTAPESGVVDISSSEVSSSDTSSSEASSSRAGSVIKDEDEEPLEDTDGQPPLLSASVVNSEENAKSDAQTMEVEQVPTAPGNAVVDISSSEVSSSDVSSSGSSSRSASVVIGEDEEGDAQNTEIEQTPAAPGSTVVVEIPSLEVSSSDVSSSEDSSSDISSSRSASVVIDEDEGGDAQNMEIDQTPAAPGSIVVVEIPSSRSASVVNNEAMDLDE